MTARQWIDQLSDESFNDDNSNGLVVMDGYDDCIIGVCRRFNDTFVVYDLQKVFSKLCADGMTLEEAQEFHDFNQLGAWVGEHAPGFIETPPRE